MEIRKIFANALFKFSNGMVKACTASLLGYGVEDIPESMKKLR